METFNGLVRTPTDAIILFEACRLGLLPRVQRRLSEKERQSIRSGSVFVWDEREAGMRRWTDGKSWSASRVSGSFLTYREMEGKRGNNFTGSAATTTTPASGRANKTPDSGNDDSQANGDGGEEGPDGYRYKPDGLMKQSFSITTSTGQHLHLISYYARLHPGAQNLRQPSNDASLASIVPAKGMYPESTINDQATVPAVTRSPMAGAPNYVMVPQSVFARPGAMPPHAYIPPGYIPHPAYMYPLSPMHTPPGHYALQPYPPHPAGLAPMGYPGPQYAQPPPPPSVPVNHAPPSSYDQRPLRTSESRPSGPPTITSPPIASSYSFAQPPPSMGYQSSSFSHPSAQLPPPLSMGESLPERPNTAPQIDPRLTVDGPSVAMSQSRSADHQSVERLHEPTTTSASQIPTIGALVHGINDVSSEEKSTSEQTSERQGSRSPGGTKLNAPPQDIPSEKLGFREDKRALSKLDRVFARV